MSKNNKELENPVEEDTKMESSLEDKHSEEEQSLDTEDLKSEYTMEDAAGETPAVKDTKEEQTEDESAVSKSVKKDDEPVKKDESKADAEADKAEDDATLIYALRTTANREDQVMDFMISNVSRKKLEVYSIICAHGMRGYIFIEAGSRVDAEQAAYGIPYARGVLPDVIAYTEMEHMIEPMKRELNIKKSDIVEIISGPFKRETAKITRIDEQKEEVVVELVEAAVPIPITIKIDSVKVIRRDSDDSKDD